MLLHETQDATTKTNLKSEGTTKQVASPTTRGGNNCCKPTIAKR
jgi:hypothetical protein